MDFCCASSVHVSFHFLLSPSRFNFNHQGRNYSLSNQPINLILGFVLVSISKMVFKKGHKSYALRLLGILLGVMASMGMVAYFINYSTEKTNKISFKAAGLKYREHFTVEEIMSVPVKPIEEKEREGKSSSLSVRNHDNKNSTKNSIAKTDQGKNSTYSTFTEVRKVSLDNTEISSDLQVLSSFDCVKSIPAVLIEYVSKTFLNEYGKAHKDFHSQYETDETLPSLKAFNIDCSIDQNCSTSFQYDKQYGLDTTADNSYRREEVFYCCPSAHSLTNQTISDVCEHGQSIVGKSVFRESKESTFLEWVIEHTTLTRADLWIPKGIHCVGFDPFSL